MSDLRHSEVILVRAPKDQVWATVSKLDQDPVHPIDAVQGDGHGAVRTIKKGKKTRTEKVVTLQAARHLVFEIEDGKAAGKVEVELEDHELGTMVIHRAHLDVKGLGKGQYKKELRKRLQAIQATVESDVAQ